ncbi:MAG: FAD-dependent oxidoreductase [Alphaproteobacteria bacterium]
MTKDERRAGSHSTRARRFKVIVVGAGPTGCIAAYRLAQAGVDVLLLEQNQHCVEDMRASTLHAPTLDMFAELGLLGPLEAQGLRAPIYHYRNRATGNLIRSIFLKFQTSARILIGCNANSLRSHAW